MIFYRNAGRIVKQAVIAVVVVGAVYFSSVLWRVSWAEQTLYGRSHILPLAFSPPEYVMPPTVDSFGSTTYIHSRNGRELRVYKQLINGFQHVYGSALVAYELGEFCSDMVFRINEYLEAYLSRTGRTLAHHIDTRKDLANNRVGRLIGIAARQKGLFGADADQFLAQTSADLVERGPAFRHYLEPRVRNLPTAAEYGCPGLPAPSDSFALQFAGFY